VPPTGWDHIPRAAFHRELAPKGVIAFLQLSRGNSEAGRNWVPQSLDECLATAYLS